MTVLRTTKITIDDPLGYPERDVHSRLRHMAKDAISGAHHEAAQDESDILIMRLKQAGKLPSAERR